MSTIKDVANHIGMSVSVVSKYLKNPDSVRKDTKEKIESAIKALNYIPSPIARSLRTKRTGMLAVVVPSIINPFFAELFEAIRKACVKESMLAILHTIETQKEIEQTVQSILSRQIDGVILCFLDQEDFLLQLKKMAPNIPIAMMNWRDTKNLSSSIVLDVKRGIFEATTHLIQQGCKKIGYIGGSKNSVISKEKFKGYLQALEESNMKSPQEMHIRKGKVDTRYGYEAMQEIYKADSSVQAVVCENDALAIGCITYCLHKSIKVPEQLMITGFDDIPLASMFEPPITTVHLPIKKMGICAVTMIQNRLQGNEEEESTVFKSNLIVRKTTKSK